MKQLTFVLQGGLSSVARVQVSVVDINDNRPTFYPVLYTVSLSAHSAPGTSVVKVTANDPDAGENGRVTYRTVPGGGSTFFTLNKDTGMCVCVCVCVCVSLCTLDKINECCVIFILLSLQGSFLSPARSTAKPTRLSPL